MSDRSKSKDGCLVLFNNLKTADLFEVVVWILEVFLHLLPDVVRHVIRVEVHDGGDEVVPHYDLVTIASHFSSIIPLNRAILIPTFYLDNEKNLVSPFNLTNDIHFHLKFASIGVVALKN